MFACTKITLSVFLLSATKSFNQRQTTNAYLYEMMNISSHKQVEKVERTEVLSLIKILNQRWNRKQCFCAIIGTWLSKRLAKT